MLPVVDHSSGYTTAHSASLIPQCGRALEQPCAYVVFALFLPALIGSTFHPTRAMTSCTTSCWQPLKRPVALPWSESTLRSIGWSNVEVCRTPRLLLSLQCAHRLWQSLICSIWILDQTAAFLFSVLSIFFHYWYAWTAATTVTHCLFFVLIWCSSSSLVYTGTVWCGSVLVFSFFSKGAWSVTKKCTIPIWGRLVLGSQAVWVVWAVW